MSAAGFALKGCVHAYRYTLRGIIGSHCRFHPSCSDYALEAITTHGAARGALMSAWRILRCNPWSKGGYDPVPGSPEHDAWLAEQAAAGSSDSASLPSDVQPSALSHNTRGEI